MKFTRNDIFTIAKKPYELGGDKSNRKVEYSEWVNFINNHSEEFGHVS